MAGILSFTAEMRAAFRVLDEDQLAALAEEADSCCTNGYSNDGSTGVEIFANGFELAEKAAERSVYAVASEDHERVEASVPVTLFFIGTPNEVIARIKKVAADNPSEEP